MTLQEQAAYNAGIEAVRHAALIDRIEGSRSTGRITAICNLGDYPKSIAAEAVLD